MSDTIPIVMSGRAPTTVATPADWDDRHPNSRDDRDDFFPFFGERKIREAGAVTGSCYTSLPDSSEKIVTVVTSSRWHLTADIQKTPMLTPLRDRRRVRAPVREPLVGPTRTVSSDAVGFYYSGLRI